jgi:hypothetical protein
VTQDQASASVRWGAKGPLDFNGVPARKYISSLEYAEGLQLLALLQADLEIDQRDSDGSFLGRPYYWQGVGTDRVGRAVARLEQAQLRRHLLGGRESASCGLCRRVLPSRMLIAGHIRPRSQATEEQRADFAGAAMLVCSLGCDALFEWGYLVVDDTGAIRSGRVAESADLTSSVAALVGQQCAAFNEATAEGFAAHKDFHERN